MSKSIVSKYLEKSTDIYHLVDENFLRGGGWRKTRGFYAYEVL